ncbi:uncharacterized protein LOC116843891 [Odontomachus brunneus]|uniref:uncharacterized protein LOC116843891 n=1 Tax=Odontomachus brunneus TaxID=486640 RepID=UPI0013F22717|nr:uncharacterized protein LOC116843891 [Odontomachus brunneus]XP_032670668.1 uncharacterized protein LOC116843891 [Odontomachus brunneus]
MDLYGKDKGNISLPLRLQSPNTNKGKLKEIIVNTQKAFYNLKIADIVKKIQRLEERNKVLENSLKDTDSSIKVLQEKRSQEISGLKLQVDTQIAKVEEYRQQVSALENTRIDHESSHAAKLIYIKKKYDDTRLKFISQLKLLNAKTNVLEDYKSVQQILEKKLEAQNQALTRDKERVSEKLHQIERKFKIDKEK